MAFVRVETLVDEAATSRPDHPALIFGERRWTYAQIRDEMDRRAAMLVAHGLAPGDIVATTEPVTDDLAITFLASCRADLTFLALSPKLTAAEIIPLVARARAARVLTATGAAHIARSLVASLPLDLPGEPDMAERGEASRRSSRGTPESVAAIQLTSGTTGGGPHLVRTPHRTLTWRQAMPMPWGDASSILCLTRSAQFLPRTFSEALACHGTIVLSSSHNPERIEAEMTVHRVTALLTVPTIARLLVEQQHPCPAGMALHVVRTGAASLPADVRQAVERRYRAVVIQSYASMEGGAMIGTPLTGASAASIGKPYHGVTVRIVDEDGADREDGAVGALVVRPPGLMLGYLDDPEATARAVHDGWLRTGDLTRRDADGFYYLEGRQALRINVGGFKVSPEEVEAVLEAHPGVREAVVLAMPDAARGEVVRAVIVPCGNPPSIADLRRFCRAHLAGYKIPRRWEFRAELPRSPLGKVLRHKL